MTTFFQPERNLGEQLQCIWGTEKSPLLDGQSKVKEGSGAQKSEQGWVSKRVDR